MLGPHAGRAVAFGVRSGQAETESPVLVCEVRCPPDSDRARAAEVEIRRLLLERWRVTLADLWLVRRGWVDITTSGKVARSRNRDRYLRDRKTPVPSLPARVANYLELQVAAAWARVLGPAGFDSEQSFFDLGGTSLQAMALAAELLALFGWEPSISQLMEAPSVAAQARLIREGQPRRWPHLVPLRSTGERPPLFMLPGMGQTALFVDRLTPLLPADRPFLTFQPPR